jgi:hypothetical protein
MEGACCINGILLAHVYDKSPAQYAVRCLVWPCHAMCRQESDVDKAAVGQRASQPASQPAAPHAQPAAPSLRHQTKTVFPAAAPEPDNHSPQHVLQQIPRAQEFNTLRLACILFQSSLHPSFATPSPASRGQPSLNHRNRPHSGLSPLAPQQPLAESSHSARTHTS